MHLLPLWPLQKGLECNRGRLVGVEEGGFRAAIAALLLQRHLRATTVLKVPESRHCNIVTILVLEALGVEAHNQGKSTSLKFFPLILMN